MTLRISARLGLGSALLYELPAGGGGVKIFLKDFQPKMSDNTRKRSDIRPKERLAMLQVSREIQVELDRRLERAEVPARERSDYRKWVRFHLDFCHNDTITRPAPRQG